MTIECEGIELNSAAEALQHANADPRMDTAILPDGTWRILTVPVNDDD